MTVSAARVMELRASTGAGMMDCKRALEETGGDLATASDFLRKKGIVVAAKKSDRETREGGIAIAFSPDHRSAALVHLACETDFVARNDRFQELLETLSAQVLENGEADLLEQKIGSGTVGDLITHAISTLGENLRLVQAARVTLAEPGLVGGYVHSNRRIGALVVLQSGSADGKDALMALGKDLAMHVAASQVSAVRTEEIDPELIAKEKEIYLAQAKEAGKPDHIVEKMVEGRLNKFKKELSLLAQPFVKDPQKTVEAVVGEAAQALGSDISVDRFVKFQF